MRDVDYSLVFPHENDSVVTFRLRDLANALTPTSLPCRGPHLGSARTIVKRSSIFQRDQFVTVQTTRTTFPFNGGDLRAMETARSQMNDYRLIYNPDETPFTPANSIALHKNFASKLLHWFGKNFSGPRVVISHNAPVINPNSKYKGGPLTPAFNSLDMVEIIETHQPALWVYGHTHECGDQMIGRTRIISNQLGYPGNLGGFECKDFDEAGLPVDVGV